MTNSVAMSPFAAPSTFDEYVQELQTFLEALPERARTNRAELAAHCRLLRERMPTLSGEAVNEALSSSWRSVADRLHALGDELQRDTERKVILSKHTELARSFEVWAAKFRRARTVRTNVPVGRMKPLFAWRTFFHVLMGVVATVCYQFFLTRTGCMIVLGSLLAVFTTLEVTRRIWPRWNEMLLSAPGFKQIARPDEFHYVNSASYFLLALCLITPVLAREAVLSGVLIVGFADPAAAWFGKRFGKKKIFRRKSWVGAFSFFATGFLVSLAYLIYASPTVSPRLIVAAAAASLTGAVAEVLSTRLDDNLTIPVSSALAAALVLAL